MTAEERYVFDRRGGTYEIRRRTLLGARTVTSGALDDLRGVQAAGVGYDDSIRGVALSRRDGTTLTLPRRTSGLSEADQARLASAIGHLLREKSMSYER
jgi:hypothetical protein